MWWAWDARLTLTAVLLVLFLGYMALRRVPAEPEVRAKRSAFVALFAAVDIPIDHFSVLWWNTLHQGATVLNPDLSPTIHGSMAWTLLLGFVALTLVFVWMLLVRYRIGVIEDWLGSGELDVALLERQAEGAPSGARRGAPGRRRPGGGGRPVATPRPVGRRGRRPMARPTASVAPVCPRGPDELRHRRLLHRPQHPVPLRRPTGVASPAADPGRRAGGGRRSPGRSTRHRP